MTEDPAWLTESDEDDTLRETLKRKQIDRIERLREKDLALVTSLRIPTRDTKGWQYKDGILE